MTRKRQTSTAAVPRGLLDHVDHLMGDWSSKRPDLDVTPISVVYRVTRLAAAWNAEIDRVFARAGMTNTDFAVLSNLLRAGSPHQLTQRQIMTSLRLTSGTVSLRIDKLAERGYVERHPDPNDARASLVTLTPTGAQAFDRVAPEHLANEARLVAALSTDEQSDLAKLLRILLIEIEQPESDRPDTRIGVTVAPAPVAQQRRAAVGLPSQAGLLIEAVHQSGPASHTGLHVGDLLISANGTELRSLTCLHNAIAAHSPALTLTALRNGKPIDVTVSLTEPRSDQPHRDVGRFRS